MTARSEIVVHDCASGAGRVVYLAYEGGGMRVVASLFGGQGTINVPSWSPDASRFAYVRYAPIEA